jgi:uncharacterized membrane protein (UPF0127 family)
MKKKCYSKKLFIPSSSCNYRIISRLKINNFKIKVDVVDKLGSGSKGLSIYDFLPENKGMLFIYDIPVTAYFWNKDVYYGIDLAFLDYSGTILEITQLKPNDETTIKSNSDKVIYTIELNEGWFKKRNIIPGMKFYQRKHN